MKPAVSSGKRWIVCRHEDIARFLNIALPTVEWRLLQARQSLKRKLGEVFALEGRRPTGVGQMRQKVMAGSPLTILFKSLPRRGLGMEWWSVWGRAGSYRWHQR